MIPHEGKCVYAYTHCAFAKYGCTWSGVYHTMEDHFREVHYFKHDIPKFCYLKGFNERANTWHQALKSDEYLFILCVIKEGYSFWFGIYSLINTEVVYNYELTFVDSEENRTASFRGICSKRWTAEEFDMNNLQSAPGMLVEGFRQGDFVKYKVEIFRKPIPSLES